MRKSWGLTEKILTREKRIESRWYKFKRKPWDSIKVGDTVYFKNSGEPISIKAEVKKVIRFSGLTPRKVLAILKKYGKDDGIEPEKIKKFNTMFKNKKYCILIFLKNQKRIKPFEINKRGFGAMAAWIITRNISNIKR